MSTDRQNSFEYFQHGTLRLLKDSGGRLVTIPTASELEGFLAIDSKSGNHFQVRFLMSEDGKTQMAFKSIWNSFLTVRNSEICPEVYSITDHDAMPVCVSSLPKGEPVNHFINRNGDIPPEVAVRLVLEFAHSLRTHNPAFHKQYAISPESIWISRTSSQPKLVLGEISPVKHPDPEAHNVELCLDLLKYLTGNPEKDNRFQGLRTQLSSGPATLEFIERLLSCYSEANPAPNYWMGFNDPASLLERIITAESAARLAADKDESVIVETAKKTLWPALIAATLAIGAFITWCLVTFAKDPHLQVAETVTYESLVPHVIQQPAPVIVRRAPPRKVQAPAPKVQAPAPIIVAAPPRVKKPAPVVITQPHIVVEQAPALSVRQPKVTPMLKSILSDTGDLFKDMLTEGDEPASEWLIKEDPEKNLSKSERETFTEEDAKKLRLLELKKAAAEAKAKNLPFEAIKHEVALLKLQPDSLEARIRLHDHLSTVQHMAINKTQISPEQIEILVEASNENSKAKDILKAHYLNDAKMMF